CTASILNQVLRIQPTGGLVGSPPHNQARCPRQDLVVRVGANDFEREIFLGHGGGVPFSGYENITRTFVKGAVRLTVLPWHGKQRGVENHGMGGRGCPSSQAKRM